MNTARIPFPFDIPTIKRKVAAFKELYGTEPVIRLYGSYVCTDDSTCFFRPGSGGRIVKLGRQFLTLGDSNTGLYYIDPVAQWYRPVLQGKPEKFKEYPDLVADYFLILSEERK